MATLQFSIIINAPKEKVWKVLWTDEDYRTWTTPFMEGSYAVSDWNEGSKISFLTPSGDGMFGVIQTKKNNEQMLFKHLGEVKGGKEELKNWEDATEGYHLQETDGITQLNVTLTFDLNPQFEEYFKKTFPKALEIVKELAEK
jgi:hypothetical protein